MPGQLLRFASMRCNPNGAIAGERLDPLLPAPDVFRAACGRIKDNNRLDHAET